MATKYTKEDLYSRKCDVCNKGMEDGFVLDSGGEYACSEECLDNMPDYSYKQYLIDYAESESGGFDSCYWTDWEQDWSFEETLFLADGTEIENPFLDEERFAELYRRT